MAATRRGFLKTTCGGAALVSFAPIVPSLLTRAAAAAAGTRDRDARVVVVVQLSGGNDGLNTVVPYGDDHYARSRPTLALPVRRLHKIDDLLGFHPRVGGFARLYRAGHLSVVQGIGYAHPSGDHATSMRVWQTADRQSWPRQPGWLGRAVDHRRDPAGAEMPAALVAEIVPPIALHSATAMVPRLRAPTDVVFSRVPGPVGRAQESRLVQAAARRRSGTDNPLLGFVRRATMVAYAQSRRVEAVIHAGRPTGTGGYPDSELARSLRTVAQLIRGELGIRIFYTELGGDGFGGFDNHANQLGNHGALLHQLSTATAAFVNDLQRDKLLDRVVLMTFSEFGRTVAENGRRGTDHGSAAPMFLVGGQVRGGLIGAHPNLTDLENGGTKHHTDFRRVYAAVLQRWLGLDSRAVLGDHYESLDVFRV